MSENLPVTPTEDTPETSAPVSQEELSEVITELEQYRERLVNETLTTAQRAKLPKSKALAQIEPLLTQIDNQLQHLHNLVNSAS